MVKPNKKFKKSRQKDEDDDAPAIGHNSGVSGTRLNSFIQRIERLEAEKTALSEDVRDVYTEAKHTGFDAKTIRKIVRLRKINVEKRREEQELLDLYCTAIGLA